MDGCQAERPLPISRRTVSNGGGCRSQTRPPRLAFAIRCQPSIGASFHYSGDNGDPMRLLTADHAKLGFIGLGNMGKRIAQRLRDHGYQLFVYDMNIAKAEAIAAQGGVVAKNILELAGTADVLLSCLTNDEAVQSVYTGPEGVFAGARSGTVVLEMSTISPEGSRKLQRHGAGVGVEVLDVAISGSTPAAEEGVLTLLIGGNEELVLGEKVGLDRERLLEVLSKTAVIAPAHVGKLARVAINDYGPQFPLRLMNKDFQLILKAAAEAHIPMPATAAAFRVNSEELAHHDKGDFSAVLRRMEEVAGIADVHSASMTS